MLGVESVDTDNLARFIRYATDHGSEHDDSYLPGPGFTPSPGFPSYILLQDDAVIGAASLMRTPRYVEAGRSRFSIFHSIEPSLQTYSLLFNAIRRHFDGLRSVYLFIPEARRTSAEAVRRLGFAVERYSFVMVLKEPKPAGLVVPEGFSLRSIRPQDGSSFRLFADAINANFDGMAGHLPMPPDGLRDWFSEEAYLEDGIALLMQRDRPVGTVCVMREFEDRNAGDISALSVGKENRRQGLGRLLLRHAVCSAVWRGLRPVYLSLNAENDAALQLYRSEGFVVMDTVVCYSRTCEP
jgi:mycothiol synthase